MTQIDKKADETLTQTKTNVNYATGQEAGLVLNLIPG
jgi:hypothetical protein